MKAPDKVFIGIKSLYILGITLFLFACDGKDKKEADDAGNANAQTPVTVTTINDSTLTDYINLNAISAFLQKNYVKANANG